MLPSVLHLVAAQFEQAILQRCFLAWRQGTLTLKSVQQAQDTIRLWVTCDSRSHLKLVLKVWSQTGCGDRKYVQLQREFRRLSELAEASEVEVEVLRELVSTQNEQAEAMRQEIYAMRDQLEVSKHSGELLDHLSRDLQKERDKVAQLQDRLQSHLDAKQQQQLSSEYEELTDLASPTRIDNTKLELTKKRIFSCVPRNVFSAWHWEAFSHKMRNVRRREESSKALNRRQSVSVRSTRKSVSVSEAMVRSASDTPSPSTSRRSVSMNQPIKMSALSRHSRRSKNDHVIQRLIEKVLTANTVTVWLAVFKAWSSVCTTTHLENTVDTMVSCVQKWQNSYWITKQATRTIIEMFMETAGGKSGGKTILLSVFKAWSGVRNENALYNMLDCQVNPMQNGQSSYSIADQFQLARRYAEHLWTANGPPSIVMMLFLHWSYTLKICCLETRLRTSATRIANLRAEEAMLLNSARTVTKLRAKLSSVKIAKAAQLGPR